MSNKPIKIRDDLSEFKFNIVDGELEISFTSTHYHHANHFKKLNKEQLNELYEKIKILKEINV